MPTLPDLIGSPLPFLLCSDFACHTPGPPENHESTPCWGSPILPALLPQGVTPSADPFPQKGTQGRNSRGTRQGGGTGCYGRSCLFAQPNASLVRPAQRIRCYSTVISPYFAFVLCLLALRVPTLFGNLPNKAFRKFALFEIAPRLSLR